MLFAIRIIGRRKASGKSTRVVIRGDHITEPQINQYFRRRPLSTNERCLRDATPATPPDLEYSTPESSPVGSPVDSLPLIDDAHVILAPRSLSTEGLSREANVTSSIQGALLHTPPSIHWLQTSKEAQLHAFGSGHENPGTWALMYDLSPDEAFLRHLYEHVRLSATGTLSQLERKSTFRSSSILRAAGWYDARLESAIEAEDRGRSYNARTILKSCAGVVIAEVDGYFPDMCVLEMVEILHFLKLRHYRQLELDFMFDLYDSLSSRLGQFHPLVELLCSAARGYACSMSSSLIPTLLDFLEAHSTGDVSLNQLLPLFAFQGLRAINTMPSDLLMHTLSQARPLCNTCSALFKNSPFQSHDLRLWAARQYVNLLIDIWVEPCVDQTSLWHAIQRSRVWRHTWKYPRLGERQQELRRMNFKNRFWAVAKLCLELVTHNVEKIFLECHDELPANVYVDRLALASSRKVGLDEDEIQPLCTQAQKTSVFELQVHTAGNCKHDLCMRVNSSLKYWVGTNLCCL